ISNRTLDAELRERRMAEERIRQLLTRLISLQEDERRRIASNLHDHLGQQMTALRLKLEAILLTMPAAADIAGRLKEIHALSARLDTDLDYLTWELRPAALDDLGLAPALRNFASEWAKNGAREADFHSRGLDHERRGFDLETNL